MRTNEVHLLYCSFACATEYLRRRAAAAVLQARQEEDDGSHIQVGPVFSAQGPIAVLHGKVCLDVQVCSRPTGCFPSMLPARVGPDEEVSLQLNPLCGRRPNPTAGV